MTINPSSIAVCTILHYPHWYPGEQRSDTNTDKIRGDLALKTLKESINKGYVTIAVSSGNEEFHGALRGLTDLHLIHRVSLKRSPAKRQAIRYAIKLAGIKVIVITEPEKVSFVKDCIPQTVAPILSGSADIVVPSRNIELFKQTYPDYMFDSEIEANFMYNEELKSHGILPAAHDGFDMFFGPRAFKNDQEIVDLFLKQYNIPIEDPDYSDLEFDQEDYSNTQYYPIVSALINEMKVASVEVPFVYPETQKLNEEEGDRESFIQKRRNQRVGIIIELMHFIRASITAP